MGLSWDEIKGNALRFSKRWKDAHNEEAQAQAFEIEFFRVFGVEDPEQTGDFEYRVKLNGGRNGYIDYLWKKQIALEMKSRGKDLSKAYEQVKDYVFHLPAEDIPDLLMVCDFETIQLHRRSTGEQKIFKTKDLHRNIKLFANIAGYETTRTYEDQIEVNVKAAEKMARLHDELQAHGYEGHDLEVYLVRLLFCLFADDTGIFSEHSFINYIENSKVDGSDLSERLSRLFEVLNMQDEVRTKRTLLSAELKQFRYINGNLFASMLSSADFNIEMRKILLDCCKFDWNKISPAIFGAMFQGVMDKNQRRELGAHYTSEENILKLINPLFMDELWEEYERVKTNPQLLDRFHDKISKLKFLDPACGCGNFLIITYRELRRLELELLKMKVNSNQLIIDISPLLKVNVEQFYGIECEDFPCQIAQVGMWLMDHQMNIRAAEQFGMYYARLPLTQSATIVHGNALSIDWNKIASKNELNYILGNPPFNGARTMNITQKNDMTTIFRNIIGAGNLDYVTAWYKKTADMMTDTRIRAAFVSTNSVSQGEQVALLWDPLFSQGIHIDFAYRTFKWSNEAKGKAAVHCVIIGFSLGETNVPNTIYLEDGSVAEVKNINAYLVNAPNVFVKNRSRPICDVPEMDFGNMPNDGKGLLSKYSQEERDKIVSQYPEAAVCFKQFIGADEFINRKTRWCLWLNGISPTLINAIPPIKEAVRKVRDIRMSSPRQATRKLADTPYLFGEIRQPEHSYIFIPAHSSEKRRYIPIGFLPPAVIAGNSGLILKDSSLYHFGILTSNVHNAWMRVVCGRIKSDYRYSKDIVYNNFPWPDATDEQKAVIEVSAQSVLDARAQFPNSSLADLYDPLTMPPELYRAHRTLDKAVLKAYIVHWKSEAECVADLMQRYQALVMQTGK